MTSLLTEVENLPTPHVSDATRRTKRTGDGKASVSTDAETEESKAEVWVERLNRQVMRSAADLIALGQLFLAAKQALEHGEWQRLFQPGKLKYHLRWAQRLMQAAKNPALAKATNWSSLPPSLYALTTLASLDPEVIQSGIEAGGILPTMTLARARRFVLDRKPQSPDRKAKPFDYAGSLHTAKRQLHCAVERVPVEQRARFVTELIEKLRSMAQCVSSYEKSNPSL